MNAGPPAGPERKPERGRAGAPSPDGSPRKPPADAPDGPAKRARQPLAGLRLLGQRLARLVGGAGFRAAAFFATVFLLAGLQSIPQSVLEAAAIDGARPVRRFWTVVFPLLSPTIFFLVVVNLTYAFFETFGVIHALTQGGPARATETLIYKAWMDGVQNLNLGTSSAQSVILMVMVVALTAFQFRFIDRKVHY